MCDRCPSECYWVQVSRRDLPDIVADVEISRDHTQDKEDDIYPHLDSMGVRLDHRCDIYEYAHLDTEVEECHSPQDRDGMYLVSASIGFTSVNGGCALA